MWLYRLLALVWYRRSYFVFTNFSTKEISTRMKQSQMERNQRITERKERQNMTQKVH